MHELSIVMNIIDIAKSELERAQLNQFNIIKKVADLKRIKHLAFSGGVFKMRY
jgi:Zn finger protein HypA/HybF involved in hydrogenase expression